MTSRAGSQVDLQLDDASKRAAPIANGRPLLRPSPPLFSERPTTPPTTRVRTWAAETAPGRCGHLPVTLGGSVPDAKTDGRHQMSRTSQAPRTCRRPPNTCSSTLPIRRRDIYQPWYPPSPATRWTTARLGGRRGGAGGRHRRRDPDRQRRHRARRRDTVSRRRRDRRGHVRLARAGPRRQRLVPRRGHRRVRGREVAPRRVVRGRRRRRRRASRCRPSPTVPAYRQEYYGRGRGQRRGAQRRGAGRRAVALRQGPADQGHVTSSRRAGVQAVRTGRRARADCRHERRCWSQGDQDLEVAVGVAKATPSLPLPPLSSLCSSPSHSPAGTRPLGTRFTADPAYRGPSHR